ncbi:MAG: hypothetical protein OEY11_15025 [Gammaproteobacteria bacterium]|nr:hypothetical protein [Gammaproteobacteria bacterium]
MHYRLLLIIFLLQAVAASAADRLNQSHTAQFPKNPAYVVLPVPYDYPGIGSGALLLANASNLMQTTTDVYFVEITGDADGHLAQISEIPLLTDRLLFSFQLQDINRGIVNNYANRGMHDSDASHYLLLDLTRANQTIFRLEYSSNLRRYNYYLQSIQEDYLLNAVRDPNGTLVAQLASPFSYQYDSNIMGITIDWTDDYTDPKSGMRFGIEITDRPAKTNNDPDYYNTSFNFLYYQPLKKNDTLVLNYFQSDAHVRTMGNTNSSDIINQLNMNCGTDGACLQAEQDLVNTLLNARRYGTADTLGGIDRLRSYPQQRFQGSHTGFIGAEYRWNLSTESSPFNYYFWKDVRRAKQIAFFAESGSVTDKASELWHDQRFTYGFGFRLLTSSGNVYRADIASGDEGTEVAVFLLYPWR